MARISGCCGEYNKKETSGMDFLFYLQGWVGMVGLMAFGNTFMCFRDHEFLSSRLYTGANDQVNGLMARLFGVWTLLSAALRVLCAFDIHNKSLYNLTLFSFVLANGHFLSEMFLYKTAPVTVGVITPLCVSGLSMVGMVIGYRYLKEPHEERRKYR